MSLMKRVGIVALGLLVLVLADSRPVWATSLPGLVRIVSSTRVSPDPGATQALVHLEVAFGSAPTLNGVVAADPLTFQGKKLGKIKLSDPVTRLSLWKDIKDADGNVTGKQVDVTVPVTPGVPTVLALGVKVKSVPDSLGKKYTGASLATITIRSNTAPVAKLTVNPFSATFGYPVTLDARDTTDAEKDSLTYTFTFGDGSPAVTGASPLVTHTYTNTTGVAKATYAVRMTADDGWGGVSTVQGSLVVNASATRLVQAMMNVASPLNNELATVGSVLPVTVNLGKGSTGADPDLATFHVTLNRTDVTSYFSNVTDPLRGNLVTAKQGAIPTSMVHMDGVTPNTLRLRIKSVPYVNLSGYTRTTRQLAKVVFTASTILPPTASFAGTPIECAPGDAVTFDASASNDPQGRPLTYAWDFGDGNTVAAAPVAVVTHAYAAAGTYVTKLTVSNGPFSAVADDSANPVVVRDNAPPPPGGGAPLLTVSDAGVDFGDLNGALNIAAHSLFWTSWHPAWLEKMVEITNMGTGTLSVSSATIDNLAFQVVNADKVTAVSLASGENYFVGLRFSPRADINHTVANGPLSGTLTLVTNAGTQTVALAGNVVSDIPGMGICLMHFDSGVSDGGLKTPAPVLDMGIGRAVTTLDVAGLINEGDAMGLITGVDVVRDDGTPSPDYSARMVNGTSPVSAIDLFKGQSLENSPAVIQVTFAPTNTGAAQRLSAKLFVHTANSIGTAGPDLVVGLTGIGVFDPYYNMQLPSIPGAAALQGFEFQRTPAGSSTNKLGSSQGSAPATLTLTNVGRKAGTVTATISGLNGGSVPAFSLNTTSLTLSPTQTGTFTVTFAPTALGHYSGILTINTGLSYVPKQSFLLHGYCKGTLPPGAPGAFGTPGNLYTFDGNDFSNSYTDGITVMLSFTAQAGALSHFSQLDVIQDPFLVVDQDNNTVDMGEYDGDWADLVMLNGGEYTIDYGILGPYSPSDPSLNNAGRTRLQSGSTIYGGCIEHHNGFLPLVDGPGNVDIQDEGLDVNRVDATPDGIVFYTEVASPNVGPTTTALKWVNPSASAFTGGVVSADISALLGYPNEEALDLRAIKTASGYRVFVVFDDSDAGNNQFMADMDLDGTFHVTAQKRLTGTASVPAPESDNGSPMILDKNGVWFSAVSSQTQHPDGSFSTTIQVYKEDLHTGASSRGLFTQATVNLQDSVNNILVDNQGNVLVAMHNGLCAFSANGAFLGYILAGTSFFSDTWAGGAANGSFVFDVSDLTAYWLDK